MASANSFNGSADWYPCAALDYMDSVPLVRAGEAQAIAVTATSTLNTKPGVYEGVVVVSDAQGLSRRMPIKITVRSFAIPQQQHLPTLWGTEEKTNKTPALFEEHRIPQGFTIYGHPGNDGKHDGTVWPSFWANVPKLRALYQQGQRTFVSSGWSGMQLGKITMLSRRDLCPLSVSLTWKASCRHVHAASDRVQRGRRGDPDNRGRPTQRHSAARCSGLAAAQPLRLSQ